jgi:hypothetical protein
MKDELSDAEDDFALTKLVEAVENQISEGQPREAGLVMIRLTEQGHDPRQALEMMAEVLARYIAASFKGDSGFDTNAYAAALLALCDQ